MKVSLAAWQKEMKWPVRDALKKMDHTHMKWKLYQILDDICCDADEIHLDGNIFGSYALMIHPNMIPPDLFEERQMQFYLPPFLVSHPDLAQRYLHELDWQCRTNSPQITQDMLDGIYGDGLREYTQHLNYAGGSLYCEFMKPGWLYQQAFACRANTQMNLADNMRDYNFEVPVVMGQLFDQVIHVRWRLELW